jgi:hypothetical protein
MNVSHQLLEHTFGPAALRVDPERCIVYGVKILGEKSRNAPPKNNVYPRSTREGAARLFEGAPVGINHPPLTQRNEVRPVQEFNGLLRNVRESGSGLYGDWHLNPEHPSTKQFLWDAQNNPKNIAFSINAEAGTFRPSAGGRIVESIAQVYSVDLVSRGATTRGLFESEQSMITTTVRALTESLRQTRPGYSRALREMAEAGLLSPDQDYAAPVQEETTPTESGDHEQALKDGFKAALIAVIDDDSMDVRGKLARLKEIMSAQEKLLGGAPSPASPAPEAPLPETESLRLQLRARDLLLEHNVRPTKVLTKALASCRSEAEVRELIESERGRPVARSAMPARAGGVQQGGAVQESGPIPVEASALGRWLRD